MGESQSLDDSRDFTIKHIEDEDPCEGVVCEPTCFGDDLHNTYCLDGKCVQGDLIEANAEICIEVPPSPDKMWMIFIAIAVVIWIILRRS